MSSVPKKISVVTPCFNEEGNVRALYEAVKKAFIELPEYTYEHIFIDNASSDQTVKILKEIASEDKWVKIIVNMRNFGVSRSPLYGYSQISGDAMIALVADLQDPPELIPAFVRKWEEGYKIVAGVKRQTEDKPIMAFTRKLYYAIVTYLSEVELIKDFNGFGLYDREVIDLVLKLNDHNVYMRGAICDMGYPIARIEYDQKARKSGKSKNNLYALYSQAIIGITSQSKLPLRLISFVGFLASILSFLVGLVYLIYKLVFWNSFNLGIAPVVIGMFFMISFQTLCLGLIGEYIGMIHTRINQKWLVIEKERINFD